MLSVEHTRDIIAPSQVCLTVPKTSVNVTGWKCGRCGHEWIPQITTEPKRCPKCKSPYWNKPRVLPVPKRGKA